MVDTHEALTSTHFREYPFTGLLLLLKLYERSGGNLLLDQGQISKIHQHIDHGIAVLLQGLQGLGQLLGLAASDQQLSDEFSKLGFFISAICNLTEALNELKGDIEVLLCH